MWILGMATQVRMLGQKALHLLPSQSPHCGISCYFIEVMENTTSFFISCYRAPNPHLLKQHLITESLNYLVIQFLDMTLILKMRVVDSTLTACGTEVFLEII